MWTRTGGWHKRKSQGLLMRMGKIMFPGVFLYYAILWYVVGSQTLGQQL